MNKAHMPRDRIYKAIDRGKAIIQQYNKEVYWPPFLLQELKDIIKFLVTEHATNYPPCPTPSRLKGNARDMFEYGEQMNNSYCKQQLEQAILAFVPYIL